MSRQRIIAALQIMPGIGPSIAIDLYDLGIRRVDDLQAHHPQVLYDTLCELRGTHVDRCVLYVFRCAVYYASAAPHDPDLLKWWNWKERAEGPWD
ncbi:MAG TPA: helix-hairpin-helix domain-containing protein [Gemmatimonadales bacterium]